MFGSANTSRFDARRSDADFLVEFDRSTDRRLADQFFGLKEELERLLERKVDLLTEASLQNPYLARSINQNRRRLFAKS